MINNNLKSKEKSGFGLRLLQTRVHILILRITIDPVPDVVDFTHLNV